MLVDITRSMTSAVSVSEYTTMPKPLMFSKRFCQKGTLGFGSASRCRDQRFIKNMYPNQMAKQIAICTQTLTGLSMGCFQLSACACSRVMRCWLSAWATSDGLL